MAKQMAAAPREPIPVVVNPGSDARMRKHLLEQKRAQREQERRDEIANVVAGTGDEGYVDRLSREIETIDRELRDVADILQAVTNREAATARRAAIRDHHATIEQTRLGFGEQVAAARRFDVLSDELRSLAAFLREGLRREAGRLGPLLPDTFEVQLAYKRFDRLSDVLADRVDEALGKTVPALSRGVRVGDVVEGWTVPFLDLANRTAPSAEDE